MQSNRRQLARLMIVLVSALSHLCSTLDQPSAASTLDTDEPRSGERRDDLHEHEREVISLFERTSASVVYITSIALRRDWYSLNIYEIPRGAGSGFVWDDRGHIVTNFHVLEGSSSARVTLSDQSTWEAEVVGVAPEKDLAVVRIQAPAKVL